MKRPELIPDWRRAWRFWTTQLFLVVTLFGSLPEKWQMAMLETLGVPGYRILAVVGVIGIVVRLVAQKRSLTHGRSDSGATKGEE